MEIWTVKDDMEALVKLSREIVSNPTPEKTGGFMLQGVDRLTANNILPIGDYDPKKADKYISIVQEKAYRLYADWLRDPTSISSWQTRRPEMNRYGGAVLFNHTVPYLSTGEERPSCSIFSFSGLSEQADEAVSLAYGYFGREVSLEWQELARSSNLAERVIEASGNQVAKEMMDVLNKNGFGFYPLTIS